MHDEDNDGKFPDESPVEVRYPRSRQEEHGGRERWPWLPGAIVEQCGPHRRRARRVVRRVRPGPGAVRTLGGVPYGAAPVPHMPAAGVLRSLRMGVHGSRT